MKAFLSGVRVLDLSRLLPGPYCTLLLAEMGAEVIKVEPPATGDYARRIPRRLGGAAIFGAVNHGKQSLALDYRKTAGRELLLRLARSADVLLETFRPGAVQRWGIGYQALRDANPGIIYCSLSGYGQEGPYRDRAGHDLNYMAVGGLLALNGVAGGPPIPPGFQVADLAGGMLAALSIVAALFGRQRSGEGAREGAYLDASMLDATVSWAAPIAGLLAAGTTPVRGGLPLSGALPCYNVYAAADGQYLALSALEPHFWAAFCKTVERPDLFTRGLDLDAIPAVAELFAGRTRAQWLALFADVDACLEAVNDLEGLLSAPAVRYRGLAQPVGRGTEITGYSASPFPGQPGMRPVPALGEHTWQVLADAGLDADEIRGLARAGVVAGPEPGASD